MNYEVDYSTELTVSATSFSAAKGRALEVLQEKLFDTGEEGYWYIYSMRLESHGSIAASYKVSALFVVEAA